jgi:hypothetical protein
MWIVAIMEGVQMGRVYVVTIIMVTGAKQRH